MQLFDEIIKLKQKECHPHIAWVKISDSLTKSNDDEINMLETIIDTEIPTYFITNDLEIKDTLEQGC